MKAAFVPLFAALTLVACAKGDGSKVEPSRTASIDWREIATDDDRARVRQWRTAWVQGLSKAEAGGHQSEIAKEGALLQPDAAIDWQTPQPGPYSCRMVKIGARGSGTLQYVAYPPFDCRLRAENGMTSFAKLTGSQRPIGLFLPDTSRRMVFLGTLQLGDEKRALQYGQDRERDMVGVVERVDERRWRIAFPYPHFESTVDVLELVPRG
ncbi:MAG: DUF4893 domain-containing protein [Sphingosinicella sp.]|nr:DUF4893 domain-containing protein [Sphingosinicella sp.]